MQGVQQLLRPTSSCCACWKFHSANRGEISGYPGGFLGILRKSWCIPAILASAHMAYTCSL